MASTSANVLRSGNQVVDNKNTSNMVIPQSITTESEEVSARVPVKIDYDSAFHHRNSEEKLKVAAEIDEIVLAVTVSPSDQCFIYITPEHVRKLNEAAYTPRVVSLGPYHNGNKKYRSMEGLKKKYCLDLIDRSNNITTFDITRSLMRYEELLRDSYSRTWDLSSSKLIAMILIDGCFILEYMLNSCCDKYPSQNIDIKHDILLQENQIPFEILKFLFKTTATVRTAMDVLERKSAKEILEGIKTYKKDLEVPKVEPLEIVCTEPPAIEPVAPVSTVKAEVRNGKWDTLRKYIKRLVQKKGKAVARARVSTEETDLWDEILVLLVKEFFKGINTNKTDNVDFKASEVIHITDLIRKLYQPVKRIPDPEYTGSEFTTITAGLHESRGKFKSFLEKIRILSKEQTSTPKYMDSKFTTNASRLHEAGVNFKMVSGKGLLDIEFKNQCLEIPTFEIDENQLSLYRNLLVLELCHYPNNTFITDYFVFMDTLIDSPDDVSLLVRNGVLFNRLGHYSDTANIFNNFCGGIRSSSDTSYLVHICAELNAYYKVPSNTWVATFKRDYFGTPLRGTSTIVAVTLLVLTFLSTIYTIKSYAKQN